LTSLELVRIYLAGKLTKWFNTRGAAMITLTAFRWVPPFARDLVRDFRVRWALKEAGIPYRERLIGSDDLVSPGYRALQPFGQVPAIETDELNLFESGAIVFYIAERSEALMPSDANGRSRGPLHGCSPH
jgi:glutathione S-transferase